MRMGGFRQGGPKRPERKEKDHKELEKRPGPLLHFEEDMGIETRPLARPVRLIDDTEEPPPDQKEMAMRSIRLRQLVDIVMELDWSTDQMDVRSSIIHEIDEKGRLLLGQTSPPILHSQIGKTVELTFLNYYPGKRGGRWMRVGYSTPIREIIDDYELGDDFRETVVAFDPPKKLNPSSARIAQRVEPTPDMDLSLRLWPDGQQLTLLDISPGGLRFSHPEWMEFAPGTRLDVALCTTVATIPLRGKVLRNEALTEKVSATVIQFNNMDKHTARLVRQLVNEMARHHRALLSGIN